MKKAVGLTMEWVISSDAMSSSSNLSLACWNSSRGFCTQIAERSTKWDAPALIASSMQFLVAW